MQRQAVVLLCTLLCVHAQQLLYTHTSAETRRNKVYFASSADSAVVATAFNSLVISTTTVTVRRTTTGAVVTSRVQRQPRGVAFSDSHFALTSQQDLQVMSVATFATAGTASITSVRTPPAFSPDGTLVAVGTATSVVVYRVGSYSAPERELRATGISEYVSVAFSPDGSRLVCAAGSRTVMYNTATWGVVFNRLEGGQQARVWFYPDSTRYLSVNDDPARTANVINAATGAVVSTRSYSSSSSESLTVSALSPDGTQFATVAPAPAGGDARVVQLWAGDQSGGLRYTVNVEGAVLAVGFLRNGNLFVSTARVDTVFGAPGVQPPATTQAPTAPLLPLALVRNHTGFRQELAVNNVTPFFMEVNRDLIAVARSGTSTLYVWRVPSREDVRSFRRRTSLRGVSFTSEGTLLAVAWFGELIIYETAEYSQVQRHAATGGRTWVSAPLFSPDGRYLVAPNTQELVMFDVQRLETPFRTLSCGGEATLAFSPNSQLLVCARGTSTRVYDVPNPQPRYSRSEGGQQARVWFYPDSTRYLSVNDDPARTANVINALTGAVISTRSYSSSSPLTVSALSSDGTQFATAAVTAAGQNVAEVWAGDQSGRLISRAEVPNTVAGLAFMPDGRLVVRTIRQTHIFGPLYPGVPVFPVPDTDEDEDGGGGTSSSTTLAIILVPAVGVPVVIICVLIIVCCVVGVRTADDDDAASSNRGGRSSAPDAAPHFRCQPQRDPPSEYYYDNESYEPPSYPAQDRWATPQSVAEQQKQRDIEMQNRMPPA